jgi:hypothetical protein
MTKREVSSVCWYFVEVLGLCCLLGSLFGLLVYALTLPGYPDFPLLFGVIASGLCGGFVGFLMPIPVGLLLYRRDLASAVWGIVIVTTIATTALGIVYPDPTAAFWTCVGAFLASAVIARLRLPRTHAPHQRPGLCRQCDYDLRGSIGMARCPECGTPFDSNKLASEMSPPQAYPQREKGRRPSMARPIVLLLVMTVLLLTPPVYYRGRRLLRQRTFEQHVQAASDRKSLIDLTEAAPFAWDDLIVLDGYSDPGEVIRQGVDWPRARSFELPSESHTMVFIQDNRVVEFFIFDYWTDFQGIQWDSRLGDENLIFRPSVTPTGWRQSIVLSRVSETNTSAPSSSAK